MKHILPILSVALMVSAAVSEPETMQSSASLHAANGNHAYTVQNKTETYKQFSATVQKYKVIPKGSKKNTQVVHAASLLPKTTSDILPVFNQSDIQANHQKIANDALKKLPKECWQTLENFYVRYDNPKSRGLAGATTMILSGNVSDDEFRALFMHEIGHVFDLNQNTACLGSTVASGLSEFKDGSTPIYNDDPSLEFYRISWTDAETQKSDQTSQNFVSGYASSNVFEDFAESHTKFILHNDVFRGLALKNAALAKKYNFFVKHLYPNAAPIAKSLYTATDKRPWDTTKLPYEWL